jgi:hypothetical protein
MRRRPVDADAIHPRRSATSQRPRRIGVMKKLIVLALLVALGVIAARRLREA